MPEIILECKNVKKHYELPTESLQVLKGVSFKVNTGDIVAIVGVSGSGKTTLLNLILGIDNISSGQIFIKGNEISSMTNEELRIFRMNNIGIIFQEFYLIPSMTAIENVMVPLIIAGKTEKFAISKAYNLLELVDMSKMANKLPNQLSNGQKQRVAIARAIANNPKILICDEPTRSLDTKLGDEIMALIEELVEKEKITIIMTTHNPEVAIRANKVFIIRNGKLIQEQIKDKDSFTFEKAKIIYKDSE